MKIIGIDNENQISTSIKALSPDPFDSIQEFEVGKDYDAIVQKVLDYGLFVELKSGLSALCHSVNYLIQRILIQNICKN